MTGLGNTHHEIHFEDYICEILAEGGWAHDGVAIDEPAYDRPRALYPSDVLDYIRTTQADAWAKLEATYGGGVEKQVLDRLVKALEKQGTLEVIRRGFNVAGGGRLQVCQSLPEDNRNETVLARYKANRLRVVRQLKYVQDRELSIDLGFFVNGIPVATAELKSDGTQSVDDAVWQYKADRKPKDPVSGLKHSLLTFKRGALIHFAVSTSEIQMTTRLAGSNTFFLPFNIGNEGGRGNPPADEGKYQVAYWWERILQPDNFLRILHSFLMLEKITRTDAEGRTTTKETMIFPRFHQWEAVTRLIDTVRDEGVGSRYLIQHSAGSGKTASISWTCHDLIRLRTAAGEKYFDSVIVVTDRTVLDSQLQEAIQQIDHQMGVVDAIDRKTSPLPKSQQLAEALLKSVPIIVVTLQTFPYAMEAILSETSLKDRRFAVIVDEAHTSQTGTGAAKLRAALSLDADEDMAEMTADDILLRLQEVRKFPENISYFAFTATAKHSTLTLFGRPPDLTQPLSDSNKPEPFHTYTMQQAIEEGFILDVLKNYTTYKAAHRLGQTVNEDQRVDGREANRALAKWFSLHPTNVAQKVDFIVQHFTSTVAHLLNGQAKAMIVTGSRASAVSYKLAIDKYVADNGIDNMKALVAFSGTVAGKDVAKELKGQEFTEANMNPGLGGQELRKAFDTPTYQVMIVANKFQTGFDQPKLVAMYLDKKVSGVEAVQTLSRLNRIYPGKDRTFVIDFANDSAEILSAFRLFYREAEIDDIQDPNIVYDIKTVLDEGLMYTAEEVAQFGVEIAKHEPSQPRLFAITQPATDRFNTQLRKLSEQIALCEARYQAAIEDGNTIEAEAVEAERTGKAQERDALMGFKDSLVKFVRMYEYIAQIIDFGDPELEAFAAYARLLRNQLRGVSPDDIDLNGLRLTHYKLLKGTTIIDGISGDGSEEDPTLRPVTGLGTGDPRDREREFLSQIILRMNDLFGTQLSDGDKVAFAQHISSKLRENETVMAQVNNNTREQAMKADLPDAATNAIVEAMTSHKTLSERLLSDQETMKGFMSILYDMLKGEGVGENRGTA
jgi:type I restriction enzyme, R subunit